MGCYIQFVTDLFLCFQTYFGEECVPGFPKKVLAKKGDLFHQHILQCDSLLANKTVDETEQTLHSIFLNIYI